MTEDLPCAFAGCPAGKRTITWLTVYYVFLVVLLATAFISIWAILQKALPDTGDLGLVNNVVGTVRSKTPFSTDFIQSGEKPFIVIPDSLAIMAVFVSGAFGGLIHGIRSFYFHVVEGDLEQADVLKLVLRPFSGAILALIFYLVLRAGLAQAQGNDASDGYSIIFYTAIGAIVGMFTDQTVAKLKKVAEAILTKPEETK